MPDLKTVDILGVQIAHTGKFNASTGPVTFTTKDFDNMEAASKELKGKVDFPLKLGHNEGQELVQEDGLPAAGWIENVRRDGENLLADFMRVPQQIADIMNAGGFRKRSLEAFRNVEFAGKRYPMVLTGTALLGEDLPAVDSLDDIEALYQTAKLEIAAAREQEDTETLTILMAIEAAGEEDPKDPRSIAESLIKELESLMAKADALIKNRRGAPQLRSLVKTATQELRAVVNGKTKAQLEGDGDMLQLDRAAIVELLGLAEDVTDEDMAEAIKVLKAAKEQASNGGAGGGPTDPTNAELHTQNQELAKKVLDLENDKAKSAAASSVDAAIKAGKFVPGVREHMISMALTSPDGFKQMVDATPDNAIMLTTVIGGSEDPEAFDLSKYRPSAEQKVLMSQTGVSDNEFILQAIEDSGDQVAEEVKASLRPKT